ncbi:hypothetical protein HPB48_016032 [Haemaphysalis longicornis]|uniref:Uncharacterized protein n=1 Tax=Haemaphysalis longicornis TaxID=44386 RepID=A0A9J6GVC2_HAELO|nr:hypothetical protein HPB48_016032 [Haemaphysalis longicornis]
MLDHLRDNIMVAPFPKNVPPQHNAGRHRAWAVAMLRQIKDSPYTVSFVDAAQYRRTSSFVAAVVNHEGQITCAATIRGPTPAMAEQGAIALALLDEEKTQIFTDSRAAVRPYFSVSIAEKAYRFLQGRLHILSNGSPARLDSQFDSLANLNDIAHVQARALTHRADTSASRGLVEASLSSSETFFTTLMG